jgi:hypothetical protein
LYLFSIKSSFGAIFILFLLTLGKGECCATNLAPNKATIEYIYPAINEVIYYQNLTLMWQNYHTSRQRLQLSQCKDFSTTLIDTMVNGNTFNIKSLEINKEYYWRIVHKTIDASNSVWEDYSFFKTTSLQLGQTDQNLKLKLIPIYAGDLQLLYIDNPELLQYTISIFTADDNIKKFDRVTCSAYQYVPTYKLAQGKYILKIHFTEKEDNNISEILLTQNE